VQQVILQPVNSISTLKKLASAKNQILTTELNSALFMTWEQTWAQMTICLVMDLLDFFAFTSLPSTLADSRARLPISVSVVHYLFTILSNPFSFLQVKA